MNSASEFQDTKSTGKNQLYFYALAMNIQKETGLEKIHLQ